jgi:hypothetical protein
VSEWSGMPFEILSPSGCTLLGMVRGSALFSPAVRRAVQNVLDTAVRILRSHSVLREVEHGSVNAEHRSRRMLPTRPAARAGDGSKTIARQSSPSACTSTGPAARGEGGT